LHSFSLYRPHCLFLFVFVLHLSENILRSQDALASEEAVRSTLIGQINANLNWYLEWQKSTEVSVSSQWAVSSSMQCFVQHFEKGVTLSCRPEKVLVTLRPDARGVCQVSDVKFDMSLRDFSLGKKVGEDNHRMCSLLPNSYVMAFPGKASQEIDSASQKQLTHFLENDLKKSQGSWFDEMLIPKVRRDVRFFNVYLLKGGRLVAVVDYFLDEEGRCCIGGNTLTGSAKKGFPEGAVERTQLRKKWFQF